VILVVCLDFFERLRVDGLFIKQRLLLLRHFDLSRTTTTLYWRPREMFGNNASVERHAHKKFVGALRDTRSN